MPNTAETRVTLSAAAFDTLRSFCAQNLKAGLDPTRYAEGLVAQRDNWGGAVLFEIRGLDAASRSPATISFDRCDDFDYADAAKC